MIQIRRPGRQEGSPARFAPGQLVRHRRYGYRGVVVDYDLACRAPDEWYLANRTQPDRGQPWYHVLVHGSTGATYAAEENLRPDYSFEPVVHPLLSRYFDGFEEGGYRRNEQPWEGA